MKPRFSADPTERKNTPIASGVLNYFDLAIAEVARVSHAGNEQHNPGEPLHWARGKSMDQADTLIRHFMERGSLDVDGLRHSAKMAWRALALLQLEIEEAEGLPPSRGSKVAEPAVINCCGWCDSSGPHELVEAEGDFCDSTCYGAFLSWDRGWKSTPPTAPSSKLSKRSKKAVPSKRARSRRGKKRS